MKISMVQYWPLFRGPNPHIRGGIFCFQRIGKHSSKIPPIQSSSYQGNNASTVAVQYLEEAGLCMNNKSALSDFHRDNRTAESRLLEYLSLPNATHFLAKKCSLKEHVRFLGEL